MISKTQQGGEGSKNPGLDTIKEEESKNEEDGEGDENDQSAHTLERDGQKHSNRPKPKVNSVLGKRSRYEVPDDESSGEYW